MIQNLWQQTKNKKERKNCKSFATYVKDALNWQNWNTDYIIQVCYNKKAPPFFSEDKLSIHIG